MTNDERLQRVLDKLPGPERKLLNALMDAYPESIENDRLAVMTNYSNGQNGAYKNPRSRLRSWDLVTYPGNDDVRASDFLFPGHVR